MSSLQTRPFASPSLPSPFPGAFGKQKFEADEEPGVDSAMPWHLFEDSTSMIYRYEVEPKPRFTFINAGAMGITGYTPAEFYADPELMLTIIHPDDRHLLEAVLRGDSASGSTAMLHLIHRQGNTVRVKLQHTVVCGKDGKVKAIEGIAHDVTALKHLEEQLYQSQKMEALGLLACGVAHDFNNILAVILGYSELLLSENDLTASTSAKVVQVKSAARRAAVLTGQLLAFGRCDPFDVKVLDVNAVVGTSSEMLRRLLGPNIKLITNLEPQAGAIKADAIQLEQILMNLAVNARSAMRSGGQIVVETKNVTVDDTFFDASLTGGPGDHVMVSVTDTGEGMSKETVAKIFQPFFTTKGVGKGTGLGLSIVYGIVKQQRGHIRVSSEPGKGTTFEILLPRVKGTDEACHSRATGDAGMSAMAV